MSYYGLSSGVREIQVSFVLNTSMHDDVVLCKNQIWRYVLYSDDNRWQGSVLLYV
jgi:hypothetical protein